MRKEIKFGVTGAIVIVIVVSAFYLASPLFISTEIDEPLPEGAEIPSSSNQFEEFMAMSEEERIEAGNQMDEQEKNQIMLEFAKMNTSIDESMTEIDKSLLEQQTSQIGNETSDLLLTGTFDWGTSCTRHCESYPYRGWKQRT